MSAKQVAAADLELSAWRSDTVRALALSLRGEHLAMQRGVDSLAASLGLRPVPSALNEEVSLAFQAQVDSLAGASGAALDRAYVQEQINSHKLMASYLDQLREVAREPAVRGWVEVADAKVAAQLSRLTTQQSAFAVADSITADSLAQRRARRTSQPTQR
jgi:predicted outer membrane protein